MSKHLKRLNAPKTWRIQRKERKYIAKATPGPHRYQMYLPLNVVMRDMLHIASNYREVKYIVNNKTVLVDGKQRKDPQFPVGLFDVVSFKETNEQYRMVLDENGQLGLIKAKEPQLKVYKIIGKKNVTGKVQLNLFDGKNILVEKNSYKVGDSILVSYDKPKDVKEHIQLEKGSLIFLTGGKHMGAIGTVEDISGNRIIYKAEDNEVIETLKEYAFPIGKTKPLITIK